MDIQITEKEHTNYPSRYKLSELVTLHFWGSEPIKNCIIDQIRFTGSKIKYDVYIPLIIPKLEQSDRFDKYTKIENVDSCFVIDN